MFSWSDFTGPQMAARLDTGRHQFSILPTEKVTLNGMSTGSYCEFPKEIQVLICDV